MNEALEARLDHLTIELSRRRHQYRTSLRNLIYLAVITLVFFSLYAAILSYKIRSIATPSTIALLIAGQLREQFSGELKHNRLNVRKTARDMAQTAVLAMPVTVHTAGELARRTMELEADSAVLELSAALTVPLHNSIERIIAAREVPDGMIDTMAGQMVNGPDFRQAESGVRMLMFPVPFAFGERLRAIRSKKGIQLTRKDLCDRDFVLCWLFLEEQNRYRDTRYARYLMAGSKLLFDSWSESASGEKSDRDQNKMNNNPIQKSVPAIP